MIEFEGIKKFNKSLKKITTHVAQAPKEIINDTMDILLDYGNKIRNDIIDTMKNTTRASWSYKRGKRKRHNPSAPGHPPAVDTGELNRSILFDIDRLELEVGVAGGAPYAEFLEFGTEKMEARPFLGPSIEWHENLILREIEKTLVTPIEEALRKGTR